MIRIVRICRQGFFMGGLILEGIFAFAYNLWPVAIPMIAEVAFMITLIILKVYYDNFGPNSMTRKENEMQHASDSENKAEEGHVVVEGGVVEQLKE